jgi:dihydropyrimidinase
VGGDADLVIIDMNRKTVVRAKDLHHISDISLFEGRELTGCPELTMVRGSVVMEDGEITGEKGFGRFIPRTVS